jgi:hypothetical protein
MVTSTLILCLLLFCTHVEAGPDHPLVDALLIGETERAKALISRDPKLARLRNKETGNTVLHSAVRRPNGKLSSCY